MSQAASKRRICSYDRLEVRPDRLSVDRNGRQMYFCNARCLCIWAVQDSLRVPTWPTVGSFPAFFLTQPTGEQRTFGDVGEAGENGS